MGQTPARSPALVPDGGTTALPPNSGTRASADHPAAAPDDGTHFSADRPAKPPAVFDTLALPADDGTPTLSPADLAELARLAATAIYDRLFGRTGRYPPPAAAALRAPGASFVTLTNHGTLRGCLGTLYPARPLYVDVANNAVRALTDPRLAPVTPKEWPHLDISVSVLSRPQPLPAATLDELTRALRPGIDGLILADGCRQATFLPAVWHHFADPAAFVRALLVKAGWPSDGWPAGLRAARYTTLACHDPAPRAPGRS